MLIARSSLALALLLAPLPAQQLYTDTVDVGGQTREFLVYVPASYDGSADVPMMFNFHGGDMTAAQMLNDLKQTIGAAHQALASNKPMELPSGSVR